MPINSLRFTCWSAWPSNQFVTASLLGNVHQSLLNCFHQKLLAEGRPRPCPQEGPTASRSSKSSGTLISDPDSRDHRIHH